MFSHHPHQFSEVSIWSGRPEGFESNTVNMQNSQYVNIQGRPRASRAAKKYPRPIMWRCTSRSCCTVLHSSHQLSTLRAGKEISSNSDSSRGGSARTGAGVASESRKRDARWNGFSPLALNFLKNLVTAVPAACLARTIPPLSNPARSSSCVSGKLLTIVLCPFWRGAFARFVCWLFNCLPHGIFSQKRHSGMNRTCASEILERFCCVL